MEGLGRTAENTRTAVLALIAAPVSRQKRRLASASVTAQADVFIRLVVTCVGNHTL